MSAVTPRDTDPYEEDEGIGLLDLAVPLAERRWLLLVAPLLVAAAAFGLSHLLPKTYTARASMLPPQQQQSSAAAALGQLGALAGLAGGLGGGSALKSPADQYVALMQSTRVADRLIDRYDLMKVYDNEYRFQTRKELGSNTRITAGKKDGLITIEVDDEDPQRAAKIANDYIEELRGLNNQLALSEAQQRRVFFESELKSTRDKLTNAQQALEASGFAQGAIKAEPKAAAEVYARLRAELTAAEVKLQTMRRNLADATPEVQQQSTLVGALRGQVAALERNSETGGGSEYISKYREFKYQETLFELIARQYELARVDESREGALIQVVDTAAPPEYKSKPKRALIAAGGYAVALLALIAWVLTRHFWRQSAGDPETAAKLADLRRALGRR
ncbi:MAG TPA: Wzz/FepE/Etk N-terminal domain-containing protein [Methylibium sp.]|uniref:Wzz/FepE/Etk N-terminal domain-containing protein n=1 Tax=Methylibium sp. TaxID=2067992 RepID=UPI002DBDAD33|nr:Wzz/FepE/Etk N-terminal domain-containing protein [Methylibium sp.]HEU4460715.1 Wzz/FepE/Etk N-terminal domain-containing protein [Methylibium sp.]